MELSRSRRQTEIILPIEDVDCTSKRIYLLGGTEKSLQSLFKLSILTDCCSLSSSAIRLQPCSQERRSRILTAYLRALQSLISSSFIDGGAKLGDVITKHAGSLTLLADFFWPGKFILSSMVRAAEPKKTKIAGSQAWAIPKITGGR